MEYLADFSDRHTPDQVIQYLDNARPLKVLLVGETIIDEYSYCNALGKSSKEPVIAARHIETELFAGGIVAITNHIAALSDNVGMLTFLGSTDSREEFVRENVNPKVDCIFLYMNGDSPTIVKKRFVEVFPFQKLFELYIMDEGQSKPAESDALCRKLEQILPDYDVVVVADYGHGMLGPEATEILSSKAPFLALNTQANAGNRGFNTVSKYSHADLICVSEPEIRLEARSRERDLREIVTQVSDQLSCDRIIVTQGKDGSLCYGKEDGFVQIPAFTRNVVDRIGAGDAVFSMAALCAAQGAPIEVVGFIGNAVGAEAVATVGHRESTGRVPLIRHIETLMK
jgi:rfaE bifunctional protein kinase chain/domain